jgi:hypothetical protein
MVDHETTPLLLSEEEIYYTPARSASRPRLSITRLFRCFTYGIARLRVCAVVKIYRGPKAINAEAGRKRNFRGKIQIKWKCLVRLVFKKGGKNPSGRSKRPRFQYDPLSYALNFDDGLAKC